MTLEQSQAKMLEGYLIRHESFSSSEYLWIDENHIIRDENGNEFELDFKLDDPMWETGWSIYKGKAIIKVHRNNKPHTEETPEEYTYDSKGNRIPPINSKHFEGLAENGIEPDTTGIEEGMIDYRNQPALPNLANLSTVYKPALPEPAMETLTLVDNRDTAPKFDEYFDMLDNPDHVEIYDTDSKEKESQVMKRHIRILYSVLAVLSVCIILLVVFLLNGGI